MPHLRHLSSWIVLACAAGSALGEPMPREIVTPRDGLVREGFEGAQPRLAVLECDGPYRIESHQLAPGAHSGYQCEELQLRLGQGTKCYVGMPVTPVRVIDELAVTAWVKCDRAGTQLLARVVLPHTSDPRTGKPAGFLAVGETYKDVGRWQALRLTDVPNQITKGARALQAQFGPQALIDTREACLDHVVLNVHTGAGQIRLMVDDVELSGAVVADASPAPGGPAVVAGSHPSGESLPKRPEIRCQGSQLIVAGRPVFVRAVEHRGEAIDFLKSLGFNAVWFRQGPAEDVLTEAARARLWVICPPPQPAATPPANPFAPLGPAWSSVLAWDLGQGLSEPHFDWFCQQAKWLRQADRGPNSQARPILCDPLTDCRLLSRHADILLPSRRPLASSLELADYGIWLRERAHLARPGMPLWTVVQTQPLAAYAAQATALAPGTMTSGTMTSGTMTSSTMPSAGVSVEQLRLLAFLGVASGARGLLFESRSRLDGQDVETRRRAMSLELVNLELGLIEPWGAAGSLLANVSTSEPQVAAGLLQIDKARLLLPMWLGRGTQFVAGQAAAANLSVVVPGIPPSHDGYQLTPVSLQRLDQRRAASGVRVVMPDFAVATMVVFTADPMVLRSLNQRVAATSQRAARLQQDLGQMKLMGVEQLHQQMTALSGASPHGPQYLALGRSLLQQSEAALRANDFQRAYQFAEQGMRPLRLLERAYWEKAIEGQSPTASPLTADSGTLPHQAWFSQALRRAAWSPNLLPAGDCEDVQKMRSAGWRLSQHPSPGVRAVGDVTTGNAHAGTFSVRLAAHATDPKSPPELLESPCVWLTTPPVKMPVGSIVRIHGWIRVPAPITSSVDGVMIFDSLAGPALAVRADAAPAATGTTIGSGAWQEFTLYRAALPEHAADGQNADLVVTFALTGLGEAWIDDVTIESTRLTR